MWTTVRAVSMAAVGAVVLAWALIPAARAALLVQCPRRDAVLDGDPFGRRVEDVTFRATDGVRLRGWYVGDDAATGTVILVHGFKSSRAEMVDRAAFLHAAHYAVLLYDSRGCGESGGTFGVGATEDRDVRGAVDLIRSRGGAAADSIAAFGLSLGAGDVLLAAAADRRIDVVIADSAWADERVQLARMATLSVGSVSIALLPYEPALVDTLIGGRLQEARPRDAMAGIAPRLVQFIHCREDDNATTPLADVQAMFEAPVNGKRVGLNTLGGCGHAGAYGAQPDVYRQIVLGTLAQSFRPRSGASDLR